MRAKSTGIHSRTRSKCRDSNEYPKAKKEIAMPEVQVDKETSMKAYVLISEFLDAVNRSDFALLNSKFGVALEIYEEIQESVKSYFWDESVNLSPPPLDVAFKYRRYRIPFQFYGNENEDKCWRIECWLWNNGEESEPTVSFDLFKENDTFRIEYNSISS
jgi:hypothetical protein